MSEVNERLAQIQSMIEVLIKKEDIKNLKEIYDMLHWKKDCHQEEIRKLDDIFYFLSGVLFSKNIIMGWGSCNFKKEGII